MRLEKTFRFEAAHWLPNVPHGHKCGRMHGHSFRVTVVVLGDVDQKSGWVMDYGIIKNAFAPLEKQLDHYLLNEIEGLENPTSEVLSQWIWNRLQPKLPQLFEVAVEETCTCRCVYRGN
ncbi:MAG: 6-carboxytetrahydropterin synthase QueD [Phycisphaerales bacterium]|nr:6-carboxytetrahydropterin synthase QueD [Planctomycetota bacterium]MBL6997759.1 6-carboxytetrahydropterin synthase QueD [Phycisphaerales bacterium]